MILDIIILVIIIALAVLGMSRGFFKTLFNLIGVVLAIILSFVFGNLASNWIYTAFFKPNILNSINATIEQEDTAQAVESIINSIPDFIYNALSGTGVTKESLLTDTQAVADNAQASVANSLEKVIGPLITAIISFFVIIIFFILLMILIKFFVRIINTVFQLPLLHTINRVFGLILGLGEGLAVVYLLVMLAKIIMPYMGDDFFINQTSINESMLFKCFLEFKLFP